MPVETTNISTLAHPTVAQAIYQCGRYQSIANLLANYTYLCFTSMQILPRVKISISALCPLEN